MVNVIYEILISKSDEKPILPLSQTSDRTDTSKIFVFLFGPDKSNSGVGRKRYRRIILRSGTSSFGSSSVYYPYFLFFFPQIDRDLSSNSTHVYPLNTVRIWCSLVRKFPITNSVQNSEPLDKQKKQRKLGRSHWMTVTVVIHRVVWLKKTRQSLVDSIRQDRSLGRI